MASQIGMSATLQNSHVVLPLPPTAAVTFSVIVAVCSVVPVALPRTVTVACPTVAVAEAATVNVDVFAVTADGVSVAGRPVVMIDVDDVRVA